MAIEMWLDGFLLSRKKMYLPNPELSEGKNTKSNTELVSLGLSVYFVGPGFEKRNNSSFRLSATKLRTSM